jgi:hypothetical protein
LAIRLERSIDDRMLFRVDLVLRRHIILAIGRSSVPTKAWHTHCCNLVRQP